MTSSPRPARRSLVSVAVAVCVGATLIGGLSGAAHAAEPAAEAVAEAPLMALVAATSAAAESIVPFASDADADSAQQPVARITEAAEQALEGAQAALVEAAETVTAVAASDLQVAGSLEIDTTDLEAQIDLLSMVELSPSLLLTDVAGAADAETARVTTATADLRDRLQEAKDKEAARKAAEEAARKAAAEKAAAEKAAAAQRTTQQSTGSGSGSGPAPASGGSSSGSNSVAGAKATARALVADRGWGSDQFSCLERLWQRESGWNYQAYNKSSGAYGIPQALPGSKMGSAGSDWKTSATTQIRWGLSYISGRYGTPCGAWNHSQSRGWY